MPHQTTDEFGTGEGTVVLQHAGEKIQGVRGGSRYRGRRGTPVVAEGGQGQWAAVSGLPGCFESVVGCRRSPPVVRPRPSPRSYAVATNYDTLLPLKNCKYFPPRTRQKETVVSFVIPFFNEGKSELKRTLESLYDQQVECGDLGVQFL
ncbi:hypothetical protein SARC_03835 [Sphaeroforma arctica JP610]|uniref:Uncharacterized protein n=1 Tax=Sphaeroforma arctica JP610 TaxID=667725 RepID=A0A0L0G541_9EUKA|nr:hypothetical protein SARC_03835 [Sphaeroforma arctica JP610]KNC83941.1 hypothetical protein SARC_03835 [Sphaeroforma arctica JP610]|eukprot:XP_014157843.1 hypothetical protein SARC_03835 [Sphaeroforma arctica JP610]